MLHSIFKSKLLPAVTIPDVDSALSIAEAFLEAGLSVMEITFRTPAAATSITAIEKSYPEMHVGAGTLLTPDNVTAAADAGAAFGLAPGYNKNVAAKALELDFPFIPGVLTPSEIESAFEAGFDLLKIFPVQCIGGPGYIKTIEPPYLHTSMKFIPMGGVNLQNMASYLKYNSVQAVGGSWLNPGSLIEQKKYREITEIVRESLGET
ncbi:MAG: bifunctional 4-hydroxy-2-oxoglutarate aldolase/2-dehydro-3-deoxy-phosphogluconate aldolase [Balneolaceae bacterium]